MRIITILIGIYIVYTNDIYLSTYVVYYNHNIIDIIGASYPLIKTTPQAITANSNDLPSSHNDVVSFFNHHLQYYFTKSPTT